MVDTLQLESKAEPLIVKSEINWDKVGTIFWLGNDLMWIQDMMYRGALPERVLQGVSKAMRYSKDLGFGEKSFPVQHLTLSKDLLEPFVGMTDIDEDKFRRIQQQYGMVEPYIERIKLYIYARVKEKQSGFKKL